MFSLCIYCKRSYPEVRPSEAHIFPYGLGGTESSDENVCDECNGRVNREVETAALNHFRIFRSLLGIEGRRGPNPRRFRDVLRPLPLLDHPIEALPGVGSARRSADGTAAGPRTCQRDFES